MLGTNRKSTTERHTSKRVELQNKPSAIESHTLSFNCTKYEKFFHYYTVCGVLVQTRGAIETKKTKLSKQRDLSTTQLVYKHSQEPVYLVACNESSSAIGDRQECDIDLLVDDNALRMSATATSYNTANSGDAIDAEQLFVKRKKKIEGQEYADCNEELYEYLKDSIRSGEFGGAVDTEKPHQFVANNLLDLVLFSNILSEHVFVYLIPVPELRRTLVQFYWCIRETKTPFCSKVAQWMLQNYTDRHGQLTSVPNSARRTTRSNNPDLNFLGSLLNPGTVPTAQSPITATATSTSTTQQTAMTLGEEDFDQNFESNDTIRTNWGLLRENTNLLTALPGFSRPTVPPQTRDSFYNAASFSKNYGFMEVIRLNQNRTDVTKLSQHSRDLHAQKMVDAAFLDDALVIDEEYQRYYETHDLKNANSDVFRTQKTNSLLSTDEIYTFTFFVDDLRRYCCANNITVEEEEANSGQRFIQKSKKKMRFECIFDNTDMLIIDDALQMAIRECGFVVMPIESDFESTAGFAPRLDEAYYFYLEKSCRSTEVQLSLCTLLNYVARLEMEQVEPFAYEPPVFDDATDMQKTLRSKKFDFKQLNDAEYSIYLTAQQASAFRWIREREDAIKAVKDRKILRAIAIGSTGWYYDCITCRIYFDENCKRKAEETLQENFSRIKRRKLTKKNKVDSGDAFHYFIEAFNRNHLGKIDSQFISHDVKKLRRVYLAEENKYDSLFISGGPASGKRVAVLAAILYDFSPNWQCKRTDEIWRDKKAPYKTRSTARSNTIDAQKAYFRQNWFERSPDYCSVEKNLVLSRNSILHYMHLHHYTILDDSDGSLLEPGEIYADYSTHVALGVLNKIILQTHEDISVQQVFLHVWRSFMLLRAENHPQVTDAIMQLVNKEDLINRCEPAQLKHSNLVSRATLIMCGEDELERWLKALDLFNGDGLEDQNTCWQFVCGEKPGAPLDASVYVIKSVLDWESFNISRCLITDIVIITYECLMAIDINDANYLTAFKNNVEMIKSTTFCSPYWMRCVRQHMSVVESTPCAGVIKKHSSIAAMNAKKRAKFQSLEQVPLEAIRWQRVVISNLESANRAAEKQRRKARQLYFRNVMNFLDNLRAVRRIYIDTTVQTPRTFVDTIFPSLKNSLVNSIIGEAMTPITLTQHRNRWKHNLGARFSSTSMSHLHPDMLLFYARKFESLSVTPNHELRNILNGAEKSVISNVFVDKDVEISVPLPEEHRNLVENILGMLKMVQDLQALYKATDSPLYTNKISMPVFFTEIGECSTLDIFKGIVGYRAPADMFLSQQSMPHNNSSISTSQSSSIPTHIFSSKDGEYVRLVRMLDRFDPIAWRDFYFSRDVTKHEPRELDVSHLKPTYRFILNAVTHAPHLSVPIFKQLAELLTYRDARLLSTMTRSNTDTPEFPFTRSNGPDILSRSSLQVNVAEAERQRAILRQAAPPPPPPPIPAQQPPQTAQQLPSPPIQQQQNTAETIVGDSPMLTPRDSLLLNRWFEQMRVAPVAVTSFDFEFPSPLCLQLRSAGKNEANQQEMLNAGEFSDFREFLFWRINTTLPEECALLSVFEDFTRPDIATAVIYSHDLDGMHVPINKVELLSKFATKSCHYRHAQVSMSDRCMFAICDTAINGRKSTFFSILKKKLTFSNESLQIDQEKAKISLNDPNFLSASGMRLAGSDETPEMRNAPLEMQRLTRRSILHDPTKLRKEFYQEFSRGLHQFYLAATGQSLRDYANKRIFERSTPQKQLRQNLPVALPESNEITMRPSLLLSDVVIFDEEGQLLVEEEDEDIVDDHLVQARENDDTFITIPRIAVPKKQAEPNTIIDLAIEQQTAHIKEVMCRYIVTEQNLLFERRCKDWMIVHLVRDLDLFLANFNSHDFFRKMPLLCRMDEQFGRVGEEKTEKQKAFSKVHQFHTQNDLLLRGAGDKQLQFTNSQINTMATLHMRHHEQILLPLIEMLIYSGHVHGTMRSVASSELQKLFQDTGTSEKEQQELLVKIVGGVKTAAPTYIVNMISKFCHETKWIQRDLDFIRQQTERTLTALPSLAKLRTLLFDYRETAKADAFECPLCMESMCEAESVALFPCGHMCCFSCHTACNSVAHRPRIDDQPIGVATVGVQCFLCRYLLQFNEKICKVTFSEAVSIIIGKDEKTPTAENCTTPNAPNVLQTPNAPVPPEILATPSRPANLPNFFDYDSSENDDDDDEADILADVDFRDFLANNDIGEVDADSSSGEYSSQDESNASFFDPEETQKFPELIKAEPVTAKIIDYLEQVALQCLFMTRKIVVCSSMSQTIKNIMRMIVETVAKKNSLSDHVRIELIQLPLDHQEDIRLVGEARSAAEKLGKIPVVIYFYHLDVHFNVSSDNCLQKLLYMNDIDAIFMVETPAPRLVDDRASHMVAANLEQRFLSLFCNEFSIVQTKVYRFIIDHPKIKTTDRAWHDETRWYK